MTASELYDLLCILGVPVFYYESKNKVSPPYIAYFQTEKSCSGSDFSNGITEETYVIELYTEQKDFALEQKLEELLHKKAVAFTAKGTYIDSEKLFLWLIKLTTIRKEGI